MDADGATFYGHGGADNIRGGAGGDAIFGGSGNDRIDAGGGADRVDAEVGNDTVLAGNDGAVDTLAGGTGTDTLDVSGSNVAVQVDFINNFMRIDGIQDQVTGFEVFVGSVHNDSIAGAGGGFETLSGGGGDDFIRASGGDDTAYGGTGNDTLNGNEGNNLLFGEVGNDTFLLDTPGSTSTLFGGENTGDSDLVDYSGRSSAVSVTFSGTGTGTGTDASFSEMEALATGSGADTINAQADAGGLRINSSSGDDNVTGGTGADTILGGAGNDTLAGGAGADLISTGDGADVVLVDITGATDTVTDFNMTLVDGRTIDQLDVSELSNAMGGPVTWRDVVVTDTNGDGTGDAILTFPGGERVVLQSVRPDQVNGWGEMTAIGIPCFAAGTPILTPSGPRLVETLEKGDLVLTPDGPAPVIWAGSRGLGRAELAADPGQLPIHFDPGAIGNTLPLRLSPQHAVQILGVDGGPVLVRAKHLAEAGLRGVRVARGVRSVTYHHLLLEQHSILSAAGALVETMYPGRVALAAFPPAARLSIAAAIYGVRRATEAKIVDLLNLSGIYGPRCFPLLSRRDALLACQRGTKLATLASRPSRFGQVASSQGSPQVNRR